MQTLGGESMHLQFHVFLLHECSPWTSMLPFPFKYVHSFTQFLWDGVILTFLLNGTCHVLILKMVDVPSLPGSHLILSYPVIWDCAHLNTWETGMPGLSTGLKSLYTTFYSSTPSIHS